MQNNNKHLQGISKLKTIEPGVYHFVIENGIKLNMVDNVRNVSVIEIAVGITVIQIELIEINQWNKLLIGIMKWLQFLIIKRKKIFICRAP